MFTCLSLAPGAGVDVALGALDLGHVDVLHRPQSLGRVGVSPIAATRAFDGQTEIPSPDRHTATELVPESLIIGQLNSAPLCLK